MSETISNNQDIIEKNPDWLKLTSVEIEKGVDVITWCESEFTEEVCNKINNIFISEANKNWIDFTIPLSKINNFVWNKNIV